MKKFEIIDVVAVATGQSRRLVRHILDATAAAARDALAQGNEVHLFGVGKLRTSDRGERKARDLRTGAAVTVPARKVVTYRPSRAFADAVNADAKA
ncbi:MAG: HU family DNA-binding protein [Burkholderiales bacterium]